MATRCELDSEQRATEEQAILYQEEIDEINARHNHVVRELQEKMGMNNPRYGNFK